MRRYTRLEPPLDEKRLRAVLDDAFAKQLVEHYFDDIRKKPRYWIYVAGDYQGVCRESRARPRPSLSAGRRWDWGWAQASRSSRWRMAFRTCASLRSPRRHKAR